MNAKVYRIQVAAQVSGVKEGLIRAWERRYNVLSPARTSGGYRTYTEQDIEVLRRLKQLTDEGVSIAQAAQLLPAIRREAKGQPPLKIPHEQQLQRWTEEILLSAQRLDQVAVDATLEEALHSTAPVPFFEDLIAPLMREVGDRWHRGTLSVAEEHLVSFSVRQKMIGLLSGAPKRGKRHVICACPEHEEHELGLLGAALRFKHAGWRVTFLGARTPVVHLDRVVRALKPDLVAISMVESTQAAKYLEAVVATLPEDTQLVVGGRAGRSFASRRIQVVEDDAGWKKLMGKAR